jgi:hypothetical protein
LQITPLTGEAMTTDFKISVLYNVDVDSPLSYRFSFYLCEYDYFNETDAGSNNPFGNKRNLI